MTTITLKFTRKTKAIEALLTLAKSISGLKVEEVKQKEPKCDENHILRAETQKALDDLHTGKNCKKYKNSEKMFKSLGINV